MKRAVAVLATLLTSALAVHAAPALAVVPTGAELVTVGPTGEPVAPHQNLDNSCPALDQSGRHVAFVGLERADDGLRHPVGLVRDRAVRSTERFTPLRDIVNAQQMSADGRVVAFVSAEPAFRVFTYNRVTGATAEVSVTPSGARANADGYAPSVSGDGRYVAFVSTATNLVGGDGSAVWKIFVRDTSTGSTRRVAVVGLPGLNTTIPRSSVSDSGGLLAFESDAALVAEDTNDRRDVYVADLVTGVIRWASAGPGGSGTDRGAWSPDLSGEGRTVVFTSDGPLTADATLFETAVFALDLRSGVTTRIGRGGNPSVSADGRWVALEQSSVVVVHDRRTGRSRTVSVGHDGGALDGFANCAAISGDGRVVSFVSNASNLLVEPHDERVQYGYAVTLANEGPVAFDRTVSTLEDTAKAITLAATDAEDDALTFAIQSPPVHGTLSGAPPNVVYNPAEHFNGLDTFTFTVRDATHGPIAARVLVDVTPVDDPPIALAQTVTTDEDRSVPITLRGTDADGDPITFALVPQLSTGHGTLSGSPPTITYAPDRNFHGSDSFFFTASSRGATSAARVRIAVGAVNDPPRAVDQTVGTGEDTPVAVTLGAVDADGDTLTFAVTTPPAHGTVTGSGPNRTYTPAPDFSGTDTFRFTATDPSGASSTGQVTISVGAVNDPPRPGNPSVRTAEDTPVSFTLTATDPEGDPAAIFVVVGPAHGTITGQGIDITYTPDPDFHGGDSVVYAATDSGSGSIGIAVITVDPLNDPPELSDATLVTDEDLPVSTVLTATDADGDPVTVSVAEGPTNGSVNLDGHALMYTPHPNVHGTDAVSLVARDPAGATAVATVAIEVTSVNDAPVLTSAPVVTHEDVPVQVPLVVTDADGDEPVVTVTVAPEFGRLEGAGATLVYHPAPDFSGEDGFTVEADDGHGGTASTLVPITVHPVNDKPFIVDRSFTTDEDTGFLVPLAVGDADGDDTTLTVTEPPANGTLDESEGGDLTYEPAHDFSGTDSLTVTATDPHGAAATAQVSIEVVEAPLIPTTLSAGPVLARLRPDLRLTFPTLAATLTAAGAPLPGRTVTFHVGGQQVCAAVTASDGTARCTNVVGSVLALVLGYTARFGGDADYAASSGTGPVVRI